MKGKEVRKVVLDLNEFDFLDRSGSLNETLQLRSMNQRLPPGCAETDAAIMPCPQVASAPTSHITSASLLILLRIEIEELTLVLPPEQREDEVVCHPH